MSGVGGYVRRKNRRYVTPEPPDGRPRCGGCHALLWRLPHVCKEVTFGTAPLPLRFEPFPDAAGEILHAILNPEPEPGPPYTHTLVLPEPEYDDDGNEVWREPDAAYTMSGPGVGIGAPPPQPSGVRIELGEPLGPPDEFRWSPVQAESSDEG